MHEAGKCFEVTSRINISTFITCWSEYFNTSTIYVRIIDYRLMFGHSSLLAILEFQNKNFNHSLTRYLETTSRK